MELVAQNEFYFCPYSFFVSELQSTRSVVLGRRRQNAHAPNDGAEGGPLASGETLQGGRVPEMSLQQSDGPAECINGKFN